jgi:hypothetical protein
MSNNFFAIKNEANKIIYLTGLVNKWRYSYAKTF